MELDPIVTLGKNIEENVKNDRDWQKLAGFNFTHGLCRLGHGQIDDYSSKPLGIEAISLRVYSFSGLA
jgi:hypothetical protein